MCIVQTVDPIILQDIGNSSAETETPHTRWGVPIMLEVGPGTRPIQGPTQSRSQHPYYTLDVAWRLDLLEIVQVLEAITVDITGSVVQHGLEVAVEGWAKHSISTNGL